MTPEALARFSTMICCPKISPSFAPKSRARRSVVPPGAAGVIRRIGRLGYSCACAASAATRKTKARNRHTRMPRIVAAAQCVPVSRLANRQVQTHFGDLCNRGHAAWREVGAVDAGDLEAQRVVGRRLLQ